MGQHTEAFTLMVAILPLLGMDIYLHRWTQASTGGLASRLATTVLVLRIGVELQVASSALVPEDVVSVRSGDPLLADGVFIAGAVIQIDEPALTGEAYPVVKRPVSQVHPAGLEARVDEAQLAFAGTRMLKGSGQL